MISWSKYSPSRANGDGAERSLPGAGASRRSTYVGASQPPPVTTSTPRPGTDSTAHSCAIGCQG